MCVLSYLKMQKTKPKKDEGGFWRMRKVSYLDNIKICFINPCNKINPSQDFPKKR